VKPDATRARLAASRGALTLSRSYRSAVPASTSSNTAPDLVGPGVSNPSVRVRRLKRSEQLAWKRASLEPRVKASSGTRARSATNFTLDRGSECKPAACPLPTACPNPVDSRRLGSTSGERNPNPFRFQFHGVGSQDRVPQKVCANAVRRVRIPPSPQSSRKKPPATAQVPGGFAQAGRASNLHGPTVDHDSQQAATRRVRTACPTSPSDSQQAAVPKRIRQ
jgi:hypothetical protein